MSLPPLPEPHHTERACGGWGDSPALSMYTAEQMREYARAAVAAEREACAVRCEVIGTTLINEPDVEPNEIVACMSCADAIRARGDA